MVSDLNTFLVIKAILAITLPKLMLLDPTTPKVNALIYDLNIHHTQHPHVLLQYSWNLTVRNEREKLYWDILPMLTTV